MNWASNRTRICSALLLLCLAGGVAGGCRATTPAAAPTGGGDRATEAAPAIPGFEVLPPDPLTGGLRRHDSYVNVFAVSNPGGCSEAFERGGATVSFGSANGVAGDLALPFGGEKRLILEARLHSAEALEKLILRVSCTGWTEVSLNDKTVYASSRTARSFDPYGDPVPGISLRRGENLLRVVTHNPGGDWLVRVSLADAKDFPLRMKRIETKKSPGTR